MKNNIKLDDLLNEIENLEQDIGKLSEIPTLPIYFLTQTEHEPDDIVLRTNGVILTTKDTLRQVQLLDEIFIDEIYEEDNQLYIRSKNHTELCDKYKAHMEWQHNEISYENLSDDELFKKAIEIVDSKEWIKAIIVKTNISATL